MSLTIGDALNQAREALPKSKTPDLDAQLLLAFVLKKSRSFILAYREQFLTGGQLSAFHKLLSERAKQIPIAYLLGEKSFWNFNLKITPDVLIPRPETELLVEKILDDYGNTEELNVLDLGTGSGAIAIALAYEKPHWQITGVDINPKAILLAEENAKNVLSNQNIAFIESDWFSNLNTEKKFNVIVSNPPYLAHDDPHLIDSEIAHEPRISLVADNQGLAAYEIIATNAHDYLKPQGKIYVEHGYQQALAVKNIFQQRGFQLIECYRDFSNNERVSVFSHHNVF